MAVLTTHLKCLGHLVARYSDVTESFIISEPVNGKTVVGLVFFPSMIFFDLQGCSNTVFELFDFFACFQTPEMILTILISC